MKNNILLLYRKLIHSLSVKLININWQFIPEIYKETFTGLEKKDVCGQNITGNFFFIIFDGTKLNVLSTETGKYNFRFDPVSRDSEVTERFKIT